MYKNSFIIIIVELTSCISRLIKQRIEVKWKIEGILVSQ